MLFNAWRRWRRHRILGRHALGEGEWLDLCRELPWLSSLDDAGLERLRGLVTLFLHDKKFYGAAGLEVDRPMALVIAALACIPVLHLGYDWLRGWRTVLVYPGEFRTRHRHEDETGLVSEETMDQAGESWERGPLVLSWEDVQAAIEWPGDGENVVFHEIAHKLDMLNGDANGLPPLHDGMDARAWARDMQHAFDGLNRELDAGRDTEIDPYAATDPAEFFAVTSEYFFEAPDLLSRVMPTVGAHLGAFYRPEASSLTAAESKGQPNSSPVSER